MKLNKKIIKKKKKNKKKTKKVIKNNIEIVSEKISFILDRADLKFIKNVTMILGPKIALKLCNETSDVEETGGINDPKLPNQRLSKLDCFLYLIENDSNISENKKNSINTQKNSPASLSTAKSTKRSRKKIRSKVNGIQSELDKLRINQVKNEINNVTSNYFAIQNLNKLNDENPFNSQSRFGNHTNAIDFIKPSTFNLNLNNGLRLTPNFSNSLLSKPRLDLDQLNFASNTACTSSSSNLRISHLQNNIFGNLQANNVQNSSIQNDVQQSSLHSNEDKNRIQININVTNNHITNSSTVNVANLFNFGNHSKNQ